MRHLMWTLLAGGLLLASSAAGWANDTVRLGGPAAETSFDGGTDTELVYSRGGYRGGNYGRGYSYGRSYYGGYGYGRSYYGGYASYRPNYGYSSYYRPYYSSYYSRPYYGSQSSYYNRPYVNYSYAPTYHYRIAGSEAPIATLRAQANYSEPLPPPQYVPPMPPASDSNGTFRYDGGPRSPIPMPAPGAGTNPANQQRGVVPSDGKLVSLPSETSIGMSLFAMPTQVASRIEYPAYGDDIVTPAPRQR